jgi:predicted nucleic acid-binding protein
VTPVLIDTGCIVALLDTSERHHERCVEVVGDLSAPLVTCEAVIAEAWWLLRSVPEAGDAILDNVETSVFEIPFRVAPACRPIRTLLKKYARVPMDLADACLVHMADELGTGQILTLDSDFKIYRWRKTRHFELLLED